MTLQISVLNLEEMGQLEIVTAKQVVHSLSRHTHDSLCIGIIETGSRVYSVPSGEYTASAGQVIVMNPGEVHACRSGDNTPYDYSVVCTRDAAKTMQMLAYPTTETIAIPYLAQRTLNDTDLFRKIFNFCHSGTATASLLELQTAWLDLFSHLIFGYGHQENRLIKKVQPEQTAIQKIYQYIETHYTEEISLQQLSDHFHISPYHLTRCFTKQFGIPPHVCQTLLRIKQVKQLLIKGMTLAEVAAETGFTDQSHLSHRFKDTVGMTPGQWLKGHI